MMSDSPRISIRRAAPHDEERLLDWRNDPLTRRNSSTTHKIDRDEHRQWFRSVLNSEDHRIFIFEIDGRSAGVVRATRLEDGWELSWAIAAEMRGKGYAGHMLSGAVKNLSGNLYAEIDPDNGPSERIARSLGMKPVGASGRFGRWKLSQSDNHEAGA